MTDNEKKEIHVNDIIEIATTGSPPPLYNTQEMGGVVVKTYPFIRGHRKFRQVSDKEYSSNDYSMLVVHKNEIEKQLKLNRDYCVEECYIIKQHAFQWFHSKFETITISEKEYRKLRLFASTVGLCIAWTQHGMTEGHIQRIKKLKELNSELKINPASSDSLFFDIAELIDMAQVQLKTIDRVVSRSVDLYKEYLALHSQLYHFDIEKLLTEMDTEPYGQHQSKRDWVQNKWPEIRDKKDSDNQADLEIQKMYKEKFDKKISTSTIQRYTGRQ